ncbi:MAG: serine/threonine-protein kinase, partial [Myxococcota bacterium]
MAEPDLAGSTLRGKYRIESLIGKGGMGTVWAAQHVMTGRKVAIKLLDEAFLSNTGVVERFGREARAASAVNHPGIVEVLDLDQTDRGVPFLVMERLVGETLTQRIEARKRLTEREALEILVPLLAALGAAHEAGVVHRDLKPDNIILAPRAGGEVVKLLDFGISQKEDERVAQLTVVGAVLGTPHYMAPEQALGESTIDARADLYAAGVVLYECLTGDVPFDAPNYNRLIHVILNAEPRPLADHDVHVDPRVDQILSRALQKSPKERVGSAEEMRKVLEAVLRGDVAEPVPSAPPMEIGELVIAKPRSSRRPSTDTVPTVAGGLGDLEEPTPGPELELSNEVPVSRRPRPRAYDGPSTPPGPSASSSRAPQAGLHASRSSPGVFSSPAPPAAPPKATGAAIPKIVWYGTVGAILLIGLLVGVRALLSDDSEAVTTPVQIPPEAPTRPDDGTVTLEVVNLPSQAT